MNCANDGNAYAPGGQNYNFSAAPAFRLRPDNGFGAWTRPDGHTATTAECGLEVTGSFWMCQNNDAAIPSLTFATHQNKDGETSWHIAQLGNYTETYGRDPSTGRVTRGEYHHFINFRCDRLMLCQNANFASEVLHIPSPQWYAPRAANAPSVDEATRGRRPFCSPATSIEGVGGIWESKNYADWRRQPKEPAREYPAWSWEDEEARCGIVEDAILRDCILNGRGTDDIGYEFFGEVWPDWNTELLYTVGGSAGNRHPIYWQRVSDAADNYAEMRIEGGMRGSCDWGTSVPKLLRDENASKNMVSLLDPQEVGLAFDLCILFRTYRYKTRHFPRNGRPEDVATGYFNTHCFVRARRVAPCLQA